MKKILLNRLIAIALIIIGLGSCKKDNDNPVLSAPSPSYHYPITIDNLIAAHWTRSGGGYYVCEIPGVPTSINPAGHNIKIYTLSDNQDVQINPSIFFMGGTLSAAITGNDVHLTFYPTNGGMPFSYLVIKIVIE